MASNLNLSHLGLEFVINFHAADNIPKYSDNRLFRGFNSTWRL